MTRKKPTRPTKRHLAKAIKILVEIAENPETPDYVRARSANALLAAGSRDPEPEADADGPRAVIFLPKKPLHPGQRDDEFLHDFNDRIKAKVEGRRAAFCEHIGEPYNPMRPLPRWPWPLPGAHLS